MWCRWLLVCVLRSFKIDAMLARDEVKVLGRNHRPMMNIGAAVVCGCSDGSMR